MRRGIVATFILLVVSSAGCAEPKQPSSRVVELAESLQNESSAMSAKKIPIIVFVSQKGCEYCRALRERVLQPLIRSGELESRAVLREVSLDIGFDLDDFQGRQVTGRAFAARYNVEATPTLLFLDSEGLALTDPIVGTGNIEFYEVYLNRAIDAATARQNLQL